MQKQSAAIVVVLLVLGLAAVAMSASVDKNPATTLKKFHPNVCGVCRSLVAEYKEFLLPTLKRKLEHLCRYLEFEEYVQKCINRIDECLNKIDRETPEQICMELGLCREAEHLNSILGLRIA